MSGLVDQISVWLQQLFATVLEWGTSLPFYVQLGAIACSVILGIVLASLMLRAIPQFRQPPTPGRLFYFRSMLYHLRVLVRPLLIIFCLAIAVQIAQDAVGESWLVRAAQSLAVISLLLTIVTNFVHNSVLKVLTKWVGVPVATLHVFGWLGHVTTYLDSISMTLGDIHLSLYALTRTLIFGTILFLIGRASNSAGKQAIRNQQNLDVGTREVFAKLFEIALFIVVFLVLLQIMGINLTALAVFGGALGVGLGFGLQQIASNFVSGIIILLDRSVAIGDYIELEDGRSGRLRDLNMRYGVIESYDGKDIMIPNETFITSSYTNWTHKDPSQRYSLEIPVAYSTDLDLLFDNIRQICAEHPQVISGDDAAAELRPDAEIAGFGDSGIDVLVEFWMEGIDDGKNRVGADLMHSIWRSIQKHDMQIPFPQREVRILKD